MIFKSQISTAADESGRGAGKTLEPPSEKRSGRVTARDIVQMLFFALFCKPFMTLFIGLRVRGGEHLPVSGPFILIANHSSHLDTISLLSLFSLTRLRNVRPVAAADYFGRNKLVSMLTKTFFNILPIARKNISAANNPVRQMKEALEAGQSLIVFPEGTRGQGDEMAPFRPGVAHLLEKVSGVPLIPTYLVNMGRSLPKGQFIPVPFFCEIRIGAPRLVTGSREEIMKSLEEAVRELRLGAQAS